MLLPEEYEDFTAEELAEELRDVDTVIVNCQKTLAETRRRLNSNMELREMLLSRQSKLLQQRGWK